MLPTLAAWPSAALHALGTTDRLLGLGGYGGGVVPRLGPDSAHVQQAVLPEDLWPVLTLAPVPGKEVECSAPAGRLLFLRPGPGIGQDCRGGGHPGPSKPV